MSVMLMSPCCPSTHCLRHIPTSLIKPHNSPGIIMAYPTTHQATNSSRSTSPHHRRATAAREVSSPILHKVLKQGQDLTKCYNAAYG